MRRLAGGIFAALVLTTTLAWGQGATGFSCRGGNLSETEDAICGDTELSRLDSEMTDVYARKLDRARGAERTDLEDDQREWLRRRNRCASDRRCIRTAYNDRLDQLVAGTTSRPRDSADSCLDSFERYCTDVDRGTEFEARCFRRHPDVLDRIPGRCHAEFRDRLSRARDHVDHRDRRTNHPLVPHGHWSTASAQGFTEYKTENGPGNSLTIACDTTFSRHRGEKTAILVSIEGKSPPRNSQVRFIIDGEELAFQADNNGDIGTECHVCSQNFVYFWQKLRLGNSMLVQFGDGRSSSFTTTGTQNLLPHNACQTGYRP